jgi:broad specificity phosphatase PhoE
VNLTLVRHGEPVRGEPDDPGLNTEGADQARRAAEFLSVEHYDALYVSPLRRALQTAEPIATALGLHPVLEEGLAEFDRGMPYTHFEDLVDARDPRVEAFFRGDLSGWARMQKRSSQPWEPRSMRLCAGTTASVCSS